jgi:hypothetical protein
MHTPGLAAVLTLARSQRANLVVLFLSGWLDSENEAKKCTLFVTAVGTRAGVVREHVSYNPG